MPEWAREPMLRAKVGDQPPLAEGNVDRESGILRGVQVLKRGETIDGRMEIDDQFMREVVDAGNAQKFGLKVHFDHPRERGEGVGTFIGRGKQFRIEDDAVRADLHLSKASAKSPVGNLYDYMLEQSDEDPGAFSPSIHFRPKTLDYRLDANGDLQVDAEGNPLPPMPRLDVLFSFDIVDEGAATDAMFSANHAAPSNEKEPTMADSKKDGAAAVVEKPEEQALSAAGPTSKPAKPSVDEEKLRAEMRAEENARILDITTAAEQLGLQEEGKKLVADVDMGYAQACKVLLKASHEKQQATLDTHSDIDTSRIQHVPGGDASDKFSTACTDGIVLRAFPDVANSFGEQRCSTARNFRGMRLSDLLRTCLQRRGEKVEGLTIDELMQRQVRLGFSGGHSTSDFPLLLADVANKSLQIGFNEQEVTWPRWCRQGSVNDFKQFRVLRISELDNLKLVPEGDEYKYATGAEEQEAGQAYTYGELVAFTRQAMINDDLDALTRLPRDRGAAARRLPDDLVYNHLMAGATGPAMGDGSDMFTASRTVTDSEGNSYNNYNYDTGTDTALDASNAQTALQTAWLLMRKLKSMRGNSIDLSPSYILIPPELWFVANQFIQSAGDPAAEKSSAVINPVRGLVKDIIISERLSNTSRYSNASATAWYLGTNMLESIRVVFLNGVEQPFLAQEEGFTIDGMRWKVRLDVGVKAIDWRSMVKMKGAS